MPAHAHLPRRRRASFLAAASGLTAALAALFAGCSEPPPLIPKGAWSVVFTAPLGSSCKHGPGENQMIGDVTGNSRTKLIEDGVDDTLVSCSVIQEESSFRVETVQSADSRTLTLAFNITANATKENPAKGTVSYATPFTGTTFTSTECNFYFLNTGQGVQAGQVWVTFECPELAAAQDDICAIDIAYAAYEQCRTQDDD